MFLYTFLLFTTNVVFPLFEGTAALNFLSLTSYTSLDFQVNIWLAEVVEELLTAEDGYVFEW